MAVASDGVRLRNPDGNWSYDVGGSYGVNLLGYDFYEIDDEHVPHELDPAYGDKPRQAFLRKTNKLAWDLAAQLTELQRRPQVAENAANDTADYRFAVPSATSYVRCTA